MFEWKEEFSIGIPLIDEQHKRLFAIGEKLSKMVMEFDDEDLYDDIVKLITEMHDYTVFHFNQEENLMEACGYEDLDEHKLEHAKFVEFLDDIDLESIDGDQIAHIKELTLFLAKWIFKHINDKDFKYSELVKTKLKL